MQVLPAIDVLDGRVVRLTRGRFDDRTTYADDPVATGKDWVAQGAPLLHVVDLDGARRGRSPVGLAAALGDAGLPFQLGGGIRDVATAERVLSAGAERVVLGTSAITGSRSLGGFMANLGSAVVVVALDVRSGRALGSGWLDSGRALPEVLESVVAGGVRRILVTGVSRDGTMGGPDLGLLKAVCAEAPGLEVIASGGVGELGDIAAVRAVGAEAVIVGRALYEKRFTLEEAITTGQRPGSEGEGAPPT